MEKDPDAMCKERHSQIISVPECVFVLTVGKAKPRYIYFVFPSLSA